MQCLDENCGNRSNFAIMVHAHDWWRNLAFSMLGLGACQLNRQMDLDSMTTNFNSIRLNLGAPMDFPLFCRGLLNVSRALSSELRGVSTMIRTSHTWFGWSRTEFLFGHGNSRACWLTRMTDVEDIPKHLGGEVKGLLKIHTQWIRKFKHFRVD